MKIGAEVTIIATNEISGKIDVVTLFTINTLYNPLTLLNVHAVITKFRVIN